MKILITGSNGQLGNEIKVLAPEYSDYEFIYTDINELDISNEDEVNKFFGHHKPSVVVNCAAYTAVDKAETDKDTAFLINATASGILARAAANINAFIVHVSTDYVYDGHNYQPYTETDALNPLSVYGKSKLAGEDEVKQAGGNAVIIRTSWLYSAFGNNFVKTMMKYGRERGLMNVVFDQTGTPTYARDLAKVILDILPQALKEDGVAIYHYSNEGVTSWYDFAKTIYEMSNITCRVNPIPTKDYPLPATRPFYSVLNKAKIKQKFGIEIPYWRESVKDCIERLNKIV
jgi:dTDP-4-dehydrorhamnose reductase